MCIVHGMLLCTVSSPSLPVPGVHDKSVSLPSTGATSVHLLVIQWNCLRKEAIMLPLTCLVHCLWLWEEWIILMTLWKTCGCVISPPSCGRRYCFLSQFWVCQSIYFALAYKFILQRIATCNQAKMAHRLETFHIVVIWLQKYFLVYVKITYSDFNISHTTLHGIFNVSVFSV